MRRLFSVLHGKTLNVGRVQTPNLKMLVDRDAAITSFKKEKYYVVRLSLGGAEASSERIRAADEAKTLKTACETSQAVCVSLTRKKKTEQPPRLFDLTGLQREANRIFGYIAKQTLDLSQALYEKRLLTYLRTDSQFLTDDMSEKAASIAAAEPHVYEAVTAVFSCAGQSFTTKGRSVCMNVSRASGAGLCGVGSITLSGEKGSV